MTQSAAVHTRTNVTLSYGVDLNYKYSRINTYFGICDLYKQIHRLVCLSLPLYHAPSTNVSNRFRELSLNQVDFRLAFLRNILLACYEQ